ncbi:ataxia telangiectasia mutated family protein [Tanacetum coccineum]
MSAMFNIEKLIRNGVQNHGGSKKVRFKQLGPGISVKHESMEYIFKSMFGLSGPKIVGGSLTGKLLDHGDALERHKVDIACFQETKWKVIITREENGYKLWYSGSRATRNGVGVVLKASLEDKVVHVNVNRSNDRIISLTLVIKGETVNVIPLGGPCTQTDYLLVRRGDLKACKDCSLSRSIMLFTTQTFTSDAYRMWNTLARIIKDAAEEALGVVIGISKTHKTRRGSWWLSEEVRSKLAVKQTRFKELLSCREGNQEDRLRAHERIRRRKDLGDISFIKYERGGSKAYCRNSNLEDQPGRSKDFLTGDGEKQARRSGLNPHRSLERSRGRGRIDEDVSHRIKATKWGAATRFLCDRNVPFKLEGKFYSVTIRPAMLYRLECWPITKALANRVKVAELRMLRWTCGKTMLDMIPNRVYRAELEVSTIINKMKEGQLRWFEHARRRPQSAPVRRVDALVVDGLRRRDRPKLRPLEDNNIKLLDITGLDQLEQQLNSFLQQVKIREVHNVFFVEEIKGVGQLLSLLTNSIIFLQVHDFTYRVPPHEVMELKMGVVKALKDQEMQLKKERKYMMDEIMAAGMDGINNDSDAAEPQPPVMGVQITW